MKIFGKRWPEKRTELKANNDEKRLHKKQHGKYWKPQDAVMAIALLAVSLGVISGVTFGWYNHLRRTEAGYVDLKSEGQMVSVDGFTIFTSEDHDNQGSQENHESLENKEYGISADKTKITLKSYDSVFGRNDRTPFYILIPVGGEAVKNEGHDLHFKIECDDNSLMIDGDPTKIKPVFSNVAQLRYIVVRDKEVLDLKSYEDAYGLFHPADGSGQTELPSTQACFVDFDVDKDTHAVDVIKEKGSIDDFSVQGLSNTGVLYVLFEMDYNLKLVTGFVDNYASGISGRLDQSHNLTFTQDTIHITISAS